VLLLFGSEDRALHKGILIDRSLDLGMGVIIPATKLAAALLSVVAFTGVYLLIHKTKIGKALRATALDSQAARYMGIPTEKMNALAWGIGGATVTAAGALLVNFWSANPYVGLLFTMIAFAIVALGGFGSIPGAFFAALIVGLLTELPGIWDFFSFTLNIDWMANVPMTSLKYTFVYLAYFLIMVVRPRGLFGWKL
jgi:branched-chain amino acid transport system permease protein